MWAGTKDKGKRDNPAQSGLCQGVQTIQTMRTMQTMQTMWTMWTMWTVEDRCGQPKHLSYKRRRASGLQRNWQFECQARGGASGREWMPVDASRCEWMPMDDHRTKGH